MSKLFTPATKKGIKLPDSAKSFTKIISSTLFDKEQKKTETQRFQSLFIII